MDKATQDRVREVIINRYQELAFEALAMYSYWGQRYEPVNKQIEDMQDRIKKAEDEIALIESAPKKTVEDRDKVKALKKDVELYDKRIEGVGTLAKKLLEKTTSYQQQGVTYLEQIDLLKSFTLKTPDEIEKENEGKTKP